MTQLRSLGLRVAVNTTLNEKPTGPLQSTQHFVFLYCSTERTGSSIREPIRNQRDKRLYHPRRYGFLQCSVFVVNKSPILIHYTLLFSIDPTSIGVTATTDSTVKVAVTGPSTSPAVDRYLAYAGKSDSTPNCTIPATSSPLECTIEGLTSVTRYTITVAACAPGGCSTGLKKAVITLIERKCLPKGPA